MRSRRSHSAPLSDIQAQAIVADRDYVSKVYGAAPAIVFQFAHMENMVSIKRIIEEKRASLDMIESMDVEMNGSYGRTKERSAKQIAAGKKWSARMNGDGDKVHGYDDGECCVRGRSYTDSDTSATS